MEELIKNKAISNFFDGFYEFDIERPHSLGKALLNFEAAVETIKKVTAALRAANFDHAECAYLLDEYYYGDVGKSDILPHQNDNYYYVLTMPELLDVEFALETLGIEAGEIRESVNNLKSELWQLLPDFYKGHTNPMPQPLTYDPKKPYPYSCVEGSLVQTRDSKLRRWDLGLEFADKYAKDMPSDDAHPSTISFEDGYVTINGKSAPTDIHWTEMYPFDDILSFAEDVISNHDPTSLMVDPEGPPIEFCTAKAPSPENVKFVVYWDSERNTQEKTVIILGAVLNRRQLAQSFIVECEKAIKNHTLGAQKNKELGYDTDLDYFHNLEQNVKRLKSII